MKQLTEKKEKIYIEAVRLVAIMLVLYCHTSVNGLLYFNLGKGNRSSELAMFLYPLAGGCVNLFFMISGALLLRKQESIGTVLKKRFLRFLMVTTIAVLIYYLLEEETHSVRGYFNALYSGGAITQQWFLYAYLSFLLILPFLQKLVSGIAEDRFYWYLLAMGLLFQIALPVFQQKSGFDAIGLRTPFLDQLIFYPLLGYFFDSRLLPGFVDSNGIKKGKWYAPVAVGTGLLLVLSVNYFMDRQSFTTDGTLAYATWFHGILIPGIYLLIGLLFAGAGRNRWFARILTFWGSGVFGTYLMEQIIRDRLFFLLEKWVYIIPEYFACWLWLLVCALCGILITNLLKLIPILRKYL